MGPWTTLLDRFMENNPDLTAALIYILNVSIMFLITVFIFGATFKVLPDARIKWKHVTIGAFVTAFLFMLGNF